jgi:hypothetical protein
MVQCLVGRRDGTVIRMTTHPMWAQLPMFSHGRPITVRSLSPAAAALVARVHGYVGALGERADDGTVDDSLAERTVPVAVAAHLGGYIEQVAQLADVSGHATSRRVHDPRLDVVTLHLAEVNSMPLSRIVELVAQAMARRARHRSKRARRALSSKDQSPMSSGRHRPYAG